MNIDLPQVVQAGRQRRGNRQTEAPEDRVGRPAERRQLLAPPEIDRLTSFVDAICAEIGNRALAACRTWHHRNF
jgi:hypothetical protein